MVGRVTLFIGSRNTISCGPRGNIRATVLRRLRELKHCLGENVIC